MNFRAQLEFSENCSASGGVAIATPREDGRFAAAQVSSGAVAKWNRSYILKCMADSISALLKKRDFPEPPEIRLIKAFVYKAIDVVPGVSTTNSSFVIIVPSASAANALRFKLPELQREINVKKRLVIRIG